ncbi:MAG: hypothetical protein R3C05_08610 [Pirellulaceae bacterium]
MALSYCKLQAGEYFAFAEAVGVYKDRLLNALTQGQYASGEMFLPSMATLFDLDSYLNLGSEDSLTTGDSSDTAFFESVLDASVSQLETDSGFVDGLLQIARAGGEFADTVLNLATDGVSAAREQLTEIFESAYVRGRSDLDFLSVHWGDVSLDADIGGMNYRAPAIPLRFWRSKVGTKLRTIGLLDSVGT